MIALKQILKCKYTKSYLDKNVIYYHNKIYFSKRKFISSSKNKPYFKEPQPYKFEVLGNGIVPLNIERPNYIVDPKHDYEKKKFAIHRNKKEIDKHRESCQITAKVLKRIEDLSLSNVINLYFIFY